MLKINRENAPTLLEALGYLIRTSHLMDAATAQVDNMSPEQVTSFLKVVDHTITGAILAIVVNQNIPEDEVVLRFKEAIDQNYRALCNDARSDD